MTARLNDLEKRFNEKKHNALFLQAKHTLEAMQNLMDEHRKYTAMQALSGVKIDGGEELVFYTTLIQVKNIIIETLERTIEDLENKWDKHYKNHFSDGVQ